MRLLFGALFLLITISVTATFWGIQTQREDALVINLAGRQRMLTQKMTWLALTQPDSPELADAIQTFEQTLSALRFGGETLYSAQQEAGTSQEAKTVTLPAAPDAELGAELEQVASSWEQFRGDLEAGDRAALQLESPLILARLDNIVSLYEARARLKLARVQAIQAVSFLAGVALLTWGYLLARRRIFTPLGDLRNAARRMSQGDLSQPVAVQRKDELGELGEAFESLRVEVAAAHENLEAQVEKRTRELEVAFEFSQEIVSQLELDQILQSVIERAGSLTSSKAAALCVLEGSPSSLVLVARSGEDPSGLNLRQPLEVDPAYRVIGAGETVVAQSECTHCRFLMNHSPGPCAVAPLRSGDQILGALCVVNPPESPIGPEERRALTLLANTAAVAMLNARLVEEGLRQAERTAASGERERLTAELHDNLAQTLGFLNLKIDHISLLLKAGKIEQGHAELAAVKSAVGEAYGQVRATLEEIGAPAASDGDFPRSLAECGAELRKAAGLNLHMDFTDEDALLIPSAAQDQALHIIREALTNVRRHARAQNAWVRIETSDVGVQVVVEDDGAGFDTAGVIGKEHMGLRLMRLRAGRCGGDLSVESAPGKGTRVILWYPLEQQHEPVR